MSHLCACRIRHFEVARETGRVGCQSALWDCSDELAAMLKMHAPKQSHNALDNHLDPVSAQPQSGEFRRSKRE